MGDKKNQEDVGQGNTPPRRIPGISKHWENYLLSILFILILPLIPIAIELWRSGKIETAELILTASMYAIGVGISSKSRLMFGLSIIMGLMYSFAYGAIKTQSSLLPSSNIVAYISIIIIFLIHSLERYNIHIVELKPWDFPGDGR